MKDARRGRSWNRVAQTAAIAALGLALSACGGGAGGSSANAASAMASPSSAQGATPTSSGATQDPATAQGSAPAQSTSAAGTSSSAGSQSSGGTSTSTTTTTTPNITSVTISWVPPTQNTDGTTLTNLAGYDIHYGTASHKYTQKVTVSNPGLARYVVDNLPSGTYYFAVAAVNSAGTESPMSAEVSATVN